LAEGCTVCSLTAQGTAERVYTLFARLRSH